MPRVFRSSSRAPLYRSNRLSRQSGGQHPTQVQPPQLRSTALAPVNCVAPCSSRFASASIPSLREIAPHAPLVSVRQASGESTPENGGRQIRTADNRFTDRRDRLPPLTIPPLSTSSVRILLEDILPNARDVVPEPHTLMRGR